VFAIYHVRTSYILGAKIFVTIRYNKVVCILYSLYIMNASNQSLIVTYREIIMNVSQLVAPVVVAPKGRVVSPEKALAKTKKTKSKAGMVAAPSALALQIEALRSELTALTGAPCSPTMGVESLTKAIERARLPVADDPEEIEEVVEAKARVIPAKAQGIGAHCVSLLKGGMKPKDVLLNALITFPEAKTSMAAIYWYKSKINCGVM
jgi:hypothetical protein